MPAIAFDLVVADRAKNFPEGLSQAYADIGATFAKVGFVQVQRSFYTTSLEDLANLSGGSMALKALHWLPASVRDITAFPG